MFCFPFNARSLCPTAYVTQSNSFGSPSGSSPALMAVLTQFMTSAEVRSRPSRWEMAMARAAFERSQTPTRRVRKVLLASCASTKNGGGEGGQ